MLSNPQYPKLSWNQRYTNLYGLPKGRPADINRANIESRYKRLRVLDGKPDVEAIGGCNEGVFLVRRHVDGKVCVQKRIDGGNRILRREIHLLHHLRHPNVVEFVDAFITNKPQRVASLYVEYCDLGSLEDVVKSYRKLKKRRGLECAELMPEAFVWHVLGSLTSALQYVHHGLRLTDPPPILSSDPPQRDESIAIRLFATWPLIVHRDIKLGNVFLKTRVPSRSEERPSKLSRLLDKIRAPERVPFPQVILADFGCAAQRIDEDWDDTSQLIGTLHAMPPEMNEAIARGDIWMVGGVALGLCRLDLYGPVPRPPRDWNRSEEDWYTDKEARRGVEEMRVDAPYSEDLDAMVAMCLKFDKVERPFSFRLLSYIKEGKERARLAGKLGINDLRPW